MAASHTSPPKPSPLLALICLAVVHRLRPDWTAVSLRTAAADCGVGVERLSRLTSRAVDCFETIVTQLTRRGRPRRDRAADKAVGEAQVTAALLEVAASLLQRLPLRGDDVRALLVGAYLRLCVTKRMLSQKRFCATMGLPVRTLRQWVTTASKTPEADITPTQPKRRRTRGLRRPRFGFDVTLPDTQLAADTTDLRVFDVPLKLVAAQDVGGRDADLLDSVIIDNHECADHVATVIAEAVGDKLGQQVISDQGTPYLAEVTRQAVEQLDADHAIQREGDPLGKATIERAFGSIKTIASPLLALTNAVAATQPALRRADLARAVATLLLTALLRAYQAGARAARRADLARAGLDEQTIRRAADRSRQQAHAEHRSANLLLTHIHQAYNLGGSLTRFIRAWRRFPLDVLRRAEAAFASQAHRDDIRNRSAYFAALVRRFHDQHRADQARRQRDRDTLERLRDAAERHRRHLAWWHENPAAHLAEALDMLAAQYRPCNQRLLLGGVGLGRVALRAALKRLAQCHGQAAADVAHGVFHAFAARSRDRLGPLGIDAVGAVFRQALKGLPTPNTNDHCAARFRSAILNETGPPSRPGPSLPLRN